MIGIGVGDHALSPHSGFNASPLVFDTHTQCTFFIRPIVLPQQTQSPPRVMDDFYKYTVCVYSGYVLCIYIRQLTPFCIPRHNLNNYIINTMEPTARKKRNKAEKLFLIIQIFFYPSNHHMYGNTQNFNKPLTII